MINQQPNNGHKLQKRITTGIRSFDKLCGKGLIENSINLVVGGPGSGKTIFAMQFLLEGCKQGETAIYVTFEEDKEKFYNHMASLGWDLKTYEDQGRFVFLKYMPEQVKKMIMEGGGAIESLITSTSAKRLVIDSITSFSLLYRNEFSKKEAALKLFNMISKWECTTLLTEQETINHAPINSTLSFEADSVILLYHDKIGLTRMRSIEVLKMRGTKHPKHTYHFNISQKGITLKKLMNAA